MVDHITRLILLISSVTVISVLSIGLLDAFNTSKVTILVENKDVIHNGKNSNYLIFTKDETFSLNDSLLGANFDTSDDYHKIKEGSCYELFLRGKRRPFFSMYRNIEKFKKIECDSL
tara:strand:- start:20906 stop:21256 length:351 start_codon:yes stop_codon:yes gene_type:complete